jgi:ribosomal protein S18 acetylase RimI-like enzyme
MADCVVSLVSGEDPALRSEIQTVLRGFNAEAGVVGPNAEPLNVRATGVSGQFAGGLVAQTYWGWVVIDVLAVEPEFRGRGLGTQLVRLTESTAVERGCIRAHTTAWAFQGFGFWQKMGYEAVGELEGYPDGHVLYWMRRDLL